MRWRRDVSDPWRHYRSSLTAHAMWGRRNGKRQWFGLLDGGRSAPDTRFLLFLLVQIECDEQLQRHLVGRIGQPEAHSKFDVEGFRIVVDDSVDLMHLIAD